MMPTDIPEIPEIPGVEPTTTAPDVNNQVQQNQQPQQPQQPAQNSNINNIQHVGNNDLIIVGRVNMPTTQLFEVTGFIDTTKAFPTANAFLNFVPGQADNTKMSGRTYVQAQRETMKIANRDLYAFAEALKFAATYYKCDFMLFTDSSKFAGNQGQQGITKRVSISAAPSKKDPNKYLIFISYQGQQKITIALERWMAIGLAEQLKTLADETERVKFKIEKQKIEERRT